jgi:tripartite-type tricarboxylate transporter receptor subunit TctC
MYQVNQLKPIARFTADPTVLVVRADSPWKTYAEFIADAKANPGKISFGSSGNYGTMHVPMEQLKSATSTFMLHVPYTGAAPAVLSLLGGQIDAVSTGPASVKQQIASGKLRALAHWGEGRLASMPEVPSFKECPFSTRNGRACLYRQTRPRRWLTACAKPPSLPRKTHVPWQH